MTPRFKHTLLPLLTAMTCFALTGCDGDEVLDKLTPEGGTGGIYVGYFLENADKNNQDVDVGGIYLDIPDDAAGRVTGRMSYQTRACQDNNVLSVDSATKANNSITGTITGKLDPTPANAINPLISEITFGFTGDFREKLAGKPWLGKYNRAGTGQPEIRTSIKTDCIFSYSVSHKGQFAVMPLDYRRGDLGLRVIGNGSTTTVTWDNQDNAAYTLVTQLVKDNLDRDVGAFVQQVVLANTDTQLIPLVSNQANNYVFVVQQFNATDNLIGFETIQQTL